VLLASAPQAIPTPAGNKPLDQQFVELWRREYPVAARRAGGRVSAA